MTTITTPFSGGCPCGAIRYESTAEPVMMLHCHCRDRQQSSGGPFSSFVIVPTEPPRIGQIFLTSRRSFAAYLIQVLVIASQPLFRGRCDLFCCDNDACLPQYNKQVTQSVGELRSL